MTHSCLRNLNLSLAASCKMEIMDKILKRYKHLQIFFNISPKKEKLLKLLANKNCFGDNRGILLRTRFFYNQPFYKLLAEICKSSSNLQKLNTFRLNLCYWKVMGFLHSRYHSKIIGDILKNV